jgi:hypothetical protein
MFNTKILILKVLAIVLDSHYNPVHDSEKKVKTLNMPLGRNHILKLGTQNSPIRYSFEVQGSLEILYFGHFPTTYEVSRGPRGIVVNKITH